MKLEFAFLCEAAKLAADGVMYVLHGGFDILHASDFPATMPRMVLIARVLVDKAECGQPHHLVAEMVDPNGDVLPVEMKVDFVPHGHPIHLERRNRWTFDLNYLDLSFPQAGDYTFRLSVDGAPIGETNLLVVKKTTGE
jgi:hypothetical protein